MIDRRTDGWTDQPLYKGAMTHEASLLLVSHLIGLLGLVLFLSGQHGIILSVREWRKIANAIRYIDKKIEVVAKRMEESKRARKMRKSNERK